MGYAVLPLLDLESRRLGPSRRQARIVWAKGAAGNVEDAGVFAPLEISESDPAAVGRYSQLVTLAPEICPNAGYLPLHLAVGAKDSPRRILRPKEHAPVGKSNEVHDRIV